MERHIPHNLENITHINNKTNTVIHYTCNAPNQMILDKYDIKSIGEQYNTPKRKVGPREVLEIPIRVYDEFEIPLSDNTSLLIISSERLLRDLSEK